MGKTPLSNQSALMKLKPHFTPRFTLDMRRGVWALLLAAWLPSHTLAFSLFGLGSTDADDTVILEVVEPYIEMHTGPGRGYPVFHVVEQGETIEVLKRKPDWYKIKTPDNKTGWSRSTQLAHTLEPTGVPVELPEMSRGDYLKSHWRAGFTAGQLEGANTFSVTAGYRPFSWVGIEIEGGKIFDESVTSDFYGGNLIVEPLPDLFISPFLSAGAGKFSLNNRQKVLVDDAGSPSYTRFGGGASYYIGRNFVLRADYRWYSISTDDGSRGLNAWTLGLNTFF
jgi:hypothetical protein